MHVSGRLGYGTVKERPEYYETIAISVELHFVCGFAFRQFHDRR